MSKRRTERLLSIVVLLLSSRRYLTAEQIRAAVSGYPQEQEAFKRMFERDKEELRDLGIPLETGRAAAFDDDLGYRISRQDYELPEIHLEPDEAAVLGIASRVWQSAELAGAATGAALKLRAASREADGASDASPPPGIQPRLTTQEPAFGPLWEAVRDRRPVTFDYLASGRSEVAKRTLEPWGVVNRRGRWYVAGHDRARNAPRVFRLSRIAGPVRLSGPPGSVKVPEGADVRELVKDWDKPLARDHTAVLRVRAQAGFALHRWGKVTPDAANPGWDRVAIDYSDTDWYAGYLASFGPDIVVLDPPELREAVIRQLKGSSHVSPQPRMVTSAERLRRLLALVPYVAARRVVGLAETAATFGMTERELIDDLNLAWCVELRAPEPYCPIDLSYEEGEISISQAESIARPLRLAADEASALLVALRMLADAAGASGSGSSEPGDGDAVARLIAKIEGAAGAAGAASFQVTIQIDRPNARGMATTLGGALSAGKRVHLRYYVPSRDEATERDVDPMRLLVVEGRTYLEGWCRRAEGVRLFRLDRVLSVDVLDVPAEVPETAEQVDVDAGLFTASPSDVLAELEVGPTARRIAEDYPCESVTELADGWLRIGLRTPDTTWLRRLALRLGEEVRVVSPVGLADEVRSAAAAALAHYD